MTSPAYKIPVTEFPPGTEIGEYIVESTLGVGGMGTVLAVRHRPTGAPLAMKVLCREHARNPALRKRFLREAATASLLRSEHAVQIFESGILDSGKPYLVMERLSGFDLAELVERRQRLLIEVVLDIGQQVACALTEAHELGIVHRDLKPANLFWTGRVYGTPIIKVLDFGISKSLFAKGPDLTTPSVTLGSPAYMAPEQMRSTKTVDHRADLWSLGVTLFELLTGSMPFTGDSMGALIHAIAFERPRPIRELRSDVPGSLAATIERCLRTDPDERHQSAHALAHDLGLIELDLAADPTTQLVHVR